MALTTSNTLLPNAPRGLLHVIRLPFWFACVLAVVGIAWRPPFESVVLISIFLILLIAVEWISRRLTRKSPKFDAEPMDAEPMDDGIRQQMIRSKTAEGRDRLDGTFWAEFPEGAMTATVHIPFSPPFERAPKVQVYPLSETDAGESNGHVRIAPPKTYGVRIDVKRSDSEVDQLCFAIIAEEECVEVDMPVIVQK